jgi:hypothetical protein
MADMVPAVYWVVAILAQALALAGLFSGISRVQRLPASRGQSLIVGCLVLLSGFVLALTALTALTRIDLFFFGLLATSAVLLAWAVLWMIHLRIRGDAAGEGDHRVGSNQG